jgi:hypothetical protein
MFKYELVKKLGSYGNFKGLKSTAQVPRHKLFARNKLSALTICVTNYAQVQINQNVQFYIIHDKGLYYMKNIIGIRQKI